MGEYLFDIVILVLLAVFAWRGAAKGLVLSLCGLAAVFVAFFCAQFLSEQFCAPVANIIRPIITESVRRVEPEPSTTDADTEVGSYTLDQLLEHIERNGLFEGFSAFLEEGVAKDAIQSSDHPTPLEALVSYLSKGIARALLFAISFLGILLVWFLLSHALDLAFKLPILSSVNTAGGLMVGLIKGGLIAVVLVWLGQLAGQIPAQPETPILSLFTVQRLGELLQDLPV